MDIDVLKPLAAYLPSGAYWKMTGDDTRQRYEPIQQQFLDYCIKKHYNVPLVNHRRACKFIRSQIKSNSGDTWNLETLQRYIKALIHLCKYQRAYMGNRNVLTKRDLLSEMLPMLPENHTEGDHGSDESLGNNPDTQPQTDEAVDLTLDDSDRGGSIPATNGDEARPAKLLAGPRRRTHTSTQRRVVTRADAAGLAVRDRALALTTHYFAGNSPAIYAAKFAHVRIKNVSLDGSGKTVRVMQIQSASSPSEVYYATRHKTAAVCPISAISLLLFQRYHIERQPFPDFDSDDWQDYALFDYDLDDPTHALTEKECHNRLRATAWGYSKLHASRGELIGDHLRMNGVQERRIESLVRSVTEHGKKRATVATLIARFRGNQPEKLSRDEAPPQALADKIFPHAAAWLAKIDQMEDKRLGHNQAAAKRFLTMMVELRNVVLQDAVYLSKQYPAWEIWQHEIFRDPEFIRFSGQLEDATANGSAQKQQKCRKTRSTTRRDTVAQEKDRLSMMLHKRPRDCHLNDVEIQQQPPQGIKHRKVGTLTKPNNTAGRNNKDSWTTGALDFVSHIVDIDKGS